MKSIAIIPARKGSKRLKNKNMRILGGKPLVQQTLDAAVESNCFDDIFLSTDDPKLFDLYTKYDSGVVTPTLRPTKLCGDKVTALEVVCDLMELIIEYDIVALLLPTCPFRTAKDIQKGMKLLTKKVDGVISLTTYEFPPDLRVPMIADIIWQPSTPFLNGNTRSQDHQGSFRPNGGFYIMWSDHFRRNKNFWKGNIKGYIMERTVDIDTEQDLKYANFLWGKR